MKLKIIEINGIKVLMQDFSLDFDEQVELMRIRECSRRANICVNKNTEFLVDEEFSLECCSHGWN